MGSGSSTLMQQEIKLERDAPQRANLHQAVFPTHSVFHCLVSIIGTVDTNILYFFIPRFLEHEHVIPNSSFSLHQAPPACQGEAVLRPGLLHVFCEGTYPRRHVENMQTPHKKALSPTQPRVWALMTLRREHDPSGN